jgi:hypothetical protein
LHIYIYSFIAKHFFPIPTATVELKIKLIILIIKMSISLIKSSLWARLTFRPILTYSYSYKLAFIIFIRYFVRKTYSR